ncbi:MAG TPA: peptide ABC transporter substrate-binding protein [Thermomicrobiales bacterium]|jgi:peptide/nickel transport system substrate-binding protein|nr:peptide ABC transporter substrate-binding protein [Thermomicrobiales bacterium]
MANGREQFEDLLRQFRARSIDRRTFLTRAGAAGMGAAASMALVGVSASAQGATPAATPVGTPDSGTPAAGTPSTSGPGEVVQLLATREEVEAEFFATYPAVEDAAQGGQFVIGDIADITTTNALLGDNSPTNPLLGLINEGLVGSSPVTGDYVPALADSAELSADGLSVTYKLHEGVTWHDGTPFTAADVILSYDAQASPDTGSAYTGSFTDTVASYEAVDDMTVRVTFNDTFARVILFGNSYAPIMPAHIWGEVPFASWQEDPGSNGLDPARVVGTGPFRFNEWQQGTSVSLLKNENYWGDVPNIDEVIHRIYPDASAAVEAVRNRELDAFENPPAADVESLEADGIEVQVYDTYSFGFYGYNMDPEKTPLFQQVEVRQALFYAIDRQSIVDNIALGYGTVANGTQPTLSVAYAPDQINTVYNYDLDRANSLLDAAGWTLGEDGVRVNAEGLRLEFEFMYNVGSAATEQTVAYIQDQWSQIGAAMTPNGVDFSTVLVPTITETYDYDIAYLGFNWDYSGDQTAMFGTNAYGAGFNFMRYSNPEFDRLAAQANVEQDSEARRQLLIEASNIVNDDLPVGIISFSEDRFAIDSERVQNYHANAYGGYLWSTQYAVINE